MISLETPSPGKPPAPPVSLEHRRLRDGTFWHALPHYSGIDEATFLDHLWQARNSVKTPEELFETIAGVVDDAFIEDARQGFLHAPMAVRVSPYLLASIDWSRPYEDPIRRQFDRTPRSPAPEPRLSARAARLTGAGPYPSLRRQSALSSASDVPGLLPILYALVRYRSRHRRRRQTRAR
jgi:lysine 2,3-aminomutase